ncbi:hypothetical protein GCM10009726_00670 [Nocardioides furvisabuli]|uniref:Uncharacterized protein n=1 Tax=Nocardioides furvisabuli TaxID=375542 RepID=A0ABN2WJS6_9ACTN
MIEHPRRHSLADLVDELSHSTTPRARHGLRRPHPSRPTVGQRPPLRCRRGGRPRRLPVEPRLPPLRPRHRGIDLEAPRWIKYLSEDDRYADTAATVRGLHSLAALADHET